MSPAQAIRVLIVEHDQMIRKALGSALEAEGLAVAGEAGDGLEAVTQVLALHPDLVLMAIDLPVLSGLDAIDRIMARQPVPILVVAAQVGVRTAFTAISKGALDVLEFQAGPDAPWPVLLKKVRLLAKVEITGHLAAMKSRGMPAKPPRPTARPAQSLSIVAIAVSTGGPQALQLLFGQLPAGFPCPIVVAQHMTSGFGKELTDWLDRAAALTVREAVQGETLRAGTAYLNPPERSMRITSAGVVHLEEPEPHLIYHPSCDFLLESVAKSYQDRAAAVILTGMGSDGVAGIRAIKAAGGVTLAQDEATSVVFGMNRLAVEAQCVDKVVPLPDLAGELLRLAAPAPR